jgi:hypothetical protein
MDVSRFRHLVVLSALAGVALVPALLAGRGRAAPPAQASEWETVTVRNPESIPVYVPDQAGIARSVSESWERSDALGTRSNWRTFDNFVSQPSINDQLTWGRRDCVASSGSWSLWSVGGGALGQTLGCKEKYPSPLPFRQNGIRTDLQFLFLDLGNTPPDGGVRITLDYMTKMPDQALFVGAGEFNAGGSTQVYGTRDFVADTADEWVRGKIIDVVDSADNHITGKNRVLVAFIYSDPPTDGQGPTSPGYYGAFIDNIHLDVMFIKNPTPIGSATPTMLPPTPTYTPSASPTNTPGIIIIPTTTTPRSYPPAHMPAAFNNIAVDARSPVPTAPTATVTPTTPPTATPTPTVTETPAPSATPTATVPPTFTPVPVPDIHFRAVAPLGEPESVWIINEGTAPQDMTGWRIFEKKKGQSCYFPDGVTLGPDEQWEFQTGRDAVAGPRVTVCNDHSLIWDNNLDEAQLWNNRNNRIEQWCYDRNGRFPCEEETPTF